MLMNPRQLSMRLSSVHSTEEHSPILLRIFLLVISFRVIVVFRKTLLLLLSWIFKPSFRSFLCSFYITFGSFSFSCTFLGLLVCVKMSLFDRKRHLACFPDPLVFDVSWVPILHLRDFQCSLERLFEKCEALSYIFWRALILFFIFQSLESFINILNSTTDLLPLLGISSFLCFELHKEHIHVRL